MNSCHHVLEFINLLTPSSPMIHRASAEVIVPTGWLAVAVAVLGVAPALDRDDVVGAKFSLCSERLSFLSRIACADRAAHSRRSSKRRTRRLAQAI